MIWQAACALCFVTLTAQLPQTAAFYPRLNAVIGLGTWTHEDITIEGAYGAVSKFLTNHGLVSGAGKTANEIINEYFGSDHDGRKAFNTRIGDLTSIITTRQNAVQDDATFSVNAERINAAHISVRTWRGEITGMLSQTLTTKVLDTILNRIGIALYTIQSFYSNTNWVEMFGPKYYADFGKEGVTLMSIASPSRETCSDCSYLVDGLCERNMAVDDTLTSGYLHSQKVYKRHGKCSHGGIYDDGRNTSATGGMNKETVLVALSPHSHLHDEAAEAAVQATDAFLYGEGDGALYNASQEVFTTIFNLLSAQAVTKSSLTLVVDVSGSMSNDVSAVIAACNVLVNEFHSSSNAPADYVLVEFNDPESVTTGYRTTYLNQIIQKLNQISVDGGGDCPEYAMSGMMKGAEMSLPGSRMYIFTDANAKDCSRGAEVMQALIAKHISATFLLTGTCGLTGCGGRRRRDTLPHHYTRRDADTPGFDLFASIAQATGGSVHQGDKSTIGTILEKVFKEDLLPSSTVIIAMFTQNTTAPDTMHIPVDSDVVALKIDITGPTSTSQVELINPDGANEANATKTFAAGKAVVSVKNPTPGLWTLKRSGDTEWKVNVTAEASFDMQVQLVKTDKHGYTVDVIGNPVSGETYSLSARLSNLPANYTVTSLALVDKSGHRIIEPTPQVTTSQTGTIVQVSFEMQGTEYFIQLGGTDGEGNAFQRMMSTPLVSVNIRMELTPTFGDIMTGATCGIGDAHSSGILNITVVFFEESLVTGVVHNISYRLLNSGGDGDFEVEVNDDMGALVSPSHITYNISSGMTVEDYVQLKSNYDDIVTYEVTVRDPKTREVRQSRSATVTFVTPSCEILHTEGGCPQILYSNDSCSAYTWFGTAKLAMTVTSLSLSSSDAVLSHEQFRSDGSPIMANVSGTCCAPSVFLSAVKPDGTSKVCHFDFENGMIHIEIQVEDKHEKIPNDTHDSKLSSGIVIGASVCGAVVLVGIFAIYLKLKMLRQRPPQ